MADVIAFPPGRVPWVEAKAPEGRQTPEQVSFQRAGGERRARLHCGPRKMKDLHDRVFLFGPFRMDVGQRALSREGRPVSLAPKEFDILQVLVEKSGQLVDKETIVSRVWPDTFVADSSLTRNISALRRALGDGVIETVPKFAYITLSSAVMTGPLVNTGIISCEEQPGDTPQNGAIMSAPAVPKV